MANIIELTDLSAPCVAVYRGLTHADPHKPGSVFLAESEKVIQYALQSGCKPVSFLMEQEDTKHIALIHQFPNIPVFTGSRQTIRQLTGYVLDRGFLCAMERPAAAAAAQIAAQSSRLVLLRNISDPTDMGTLFRSAAALGIDGILIDRGCCDPLYRRSVRVSMGTVFQIPWGFISEHTSLPLDDFICIRVTPNTAASPLEPERWKHQEKLAVIFDPKDPAGSFGIPLMPDSEPLNMAAASAVLFWMLRKA